MGIRGRHANATAVAVALALVGACGGGGEEPAVVADAPTSPSSSAPAAASSSSAPASSSGPATSSSSAGPATSSAPAATSSSVPASSGPAAAGGFEGSTERQSSPAAGPAYLRAVRADRHDGFDRVVFEFEGQLPGYSVGYAEGPLAADGSGDPVSLPGEGVLEVRMEQASGVRIDGEKVEETYAGPPRLPGGGEVVTEIVRSGDFEGQLTWGIGVRHVVPFRISTLQGPPRVVVDVAATAA